MPNLNLNLDFAWPWAALALLFLLPLWLFYKKRAVENGVLLSPMVPILAKIGEGSRVKSAAPRINWLAIFWWTLLVLALMRPQYVGDAIEISRDGRTIMVVVDISESMEAEDMELLGKPSDRLTVAKDVLKNFIDKRRGDRIGLVVFGSEAFLHAPLSFDHPTIKQFLDEAQIGFAGPKTAIGDAIGLSVKKLYQEKGDRVMILLTDGQNNMGVLEPMQAAKLAKEQGIKIYTVGMGASSMVVDSFFGPASINPSASLDQAEPELTEIATSTGGKYFRAKDHQALAGIYGEIDKLEPIKADPLVIVPKKELFYWPLAIQACWLLLILLFRLRPWTLAFWTRGEQP